MAVHGDELPGWGLSEKGLPVREEEAHALAGDAHRQEAHETREKYHGQPAVARRPGAREAAATTPH